MICLVCDVIFNGHYGGINAPGYVICFQFINYWNKPQEFKLLVCIQWSEADGIPNGNGMGRHNGDTGVKMNILGSSGLGHLIFDLCCQLLSEG